MARIRTVKPETFRHGDLQDLEAAHPGQHLILVWIALFGHCDKEGSFKWDPRELKLDILPFLDFDLGASLVLLWEAGQLERYEIDGKQYGFIHTFKDHQRIAGKEAQAPAKYPPHNGNFTVRSQGKIGEAPGKHPGALEGKGKEEEGKGKVPTTSGAIAPEAPDRGGDGIPELPGFLDRREPKPAPDKPLFDYGKEVLGQSAGGLITRLKAHSGIDGAMEHLREAAGKSNPREWIGAVLADPEAKADRESDAWEEDYYRGVQ